MGVLSAGSCEAACQPRAANTRMALRIVLMTSPGGNFMVTRRSDRVLAAGGVHATSAHTWSKHFRAVAVCGLRSLPANYKTQVGFSGLGAEHLSGFV